MAPSDTDVLVDVVIVARNCARALQRTLERIPRRGLRSIVVVDNGSTDQSGQVARDLGAVVLRAPKGGHGAACKRALRHLHQLPNRPDVVVFLDPLGPEDPAGLPKLLAPLRTQTAELVLATALERRDRKPTTGEKAVLGLMGIIYGHNFSEVSGFRAVKYPALVALGMNADADGWDVEMMVKSVRLGLHIAEVPMARLANAGEGAQRTKGTGHKLLRILRHAAAR